MSFASNTPVHFLPGVGSRTARVLHSLGLHTAGQLSKVPEQLLVELFGPSIRQILQILHVTAPSHATQYRATVTQQPTVQEEPQKKKTLASRLRFAAQVLSIA